MPRRSLGAQLRAHISAANASHNYRLFHRVAREWLAKFRVQDDAVEHFGNAVRVAHLFLMTDDAAKQRHLLGLLKAALTDRLVGGLRRHQQHQCVIPLDRFDRCDETVEARADLRKSRR